MAEKRTLISVGFPAELATEIDRAWRSDLEYKSRSDYIIKTVACKLGYKL